MDVAQVFDKTFRDGFTHKIQKPIPNLFQNILESYLSNRRFTVKVNEYITKEYPISVVVVSTIHRRQSF